MRIEKLVLFLPLFFAIVTSSLAQDPIPVFLPDTTGETTTSVTIPLRVGDLTGRGVISYQAVITFEENVLDATGASSSGTLTQSWGPPFANTTVDGEINVGGFSFLTLSGSGTLVNLLFDVVGNPGDTTRLDFQSFLFNGGDPSADTRGGKFTVTQVIPVELSSFSAVVMGNAVQLSWSTETESNNYGFDVERIENGVDFTRIGFRSGKGTTTDPQDYFFVDGDLHPGIYYYRLKQIDTDGSLEYSPVVRAEITTPTRYELRQNYPNPFNPETVIAYQLAHKKPQMTTLKIYNMAGALVRTLVEESQNGGEYEVVWDGKDDSGAVVSSGLYLYQLISGDFPQTEKMVRLK
jgi:hypothetical protein